MQWLLDALGKHTVGLHGHKHIRGLEAHLEVGKIEPLKDVDMAHGRLHHGRWGRLTIVLQ